tara:strand:+ start:209 stop:508 length:300 start_codon:yes stop_codon:yes gene_type:complete
MNINFNDEVLDVTVKDRVVISKQQRNGRKSWTIIENFAENLSEDKSVKDFIKHIKKTKCCNGSIKDGVILLQGDCVDYVKELLISDYNYTIDNIETKGV